MSDNISRQAAMAYPLSWEHYDMEHGDRKFICGVESYREYIEHLPSVDGWIPCSERLPEKGQLCICSDGNSVTIDRYKGEEPQYKWAIYLGDYEAWMPLPEPYKKSNEKPCTVASANVESYGESY